jgi:hypothetical protein
MRERARAMFLLNQSSAINISRKTPKNLRRNGGQPVMKSIVEVLRQKEAELQKLQGEVEALRVAMRILSDDAESSARAAAPAGTPSEFRVKESLTVPEAPARQFP